MFGDSGGVHRTHAIFDATPYREVAFNGSFTREAGADPAPIALAEAGTLRVDHRESCPLDGRGNPEAHPANSHFLVYLLPDRRIRRHPNVNCQRGVAPPQMQSARLPTIWFNPNACPELIARPPRGKSLCFSPRAASLEFRHPCEPMHTWASARRAFGGRMWRETSATNSGAYLLVWMDPLQKGVTHRKVTRLAMPERGIAPVGRRRRASPFLRHTSWASAAPSRSWGCLCGRKTARGKEAASLQSLAQWIVVARYYRARGIGPFAPLDSLRQALSVVRHRWDPRPLTGTLRPVLPLLKQREIPILRRPSTRAPCAIRTKGLSSKWRK